ncbi:ArsR/SmtB family transcription factor [Aliiglaciecola lipolytica]|uniref:Probable HTH-type transcriptional regulator ygaV n=1 Tax=Aliiglaciecola lipolytica E3 TaxID=1127673 RepID=K6WZJ5_9ALTE|nr:metalloregulator ArsR/SmtB family transcription factor [Aliiglaciecola lipolytica]GAC13824.1 probable HTH-type transcriptional regulator ygaV [Aliiglaciecola lipolytica E3]
MNLTEMQANAEHAATLLRAMANKNRLLILCLLNKGELSVSQIMIELDIPQSTLSQHLSVLRKDNLVINRREAQTIYYALASKEVEAIIATLYGLFCEE